MSSICFQSKQGEAYIGGRERHYCKWLCQQLVAAVFDPVRLIEEADAQRRPKVLAALGLRPDATRPEYQYLMMGVIDRPITICGRSWSPFDLALNTALALGSDPVRLCARLHGQCEIHAYVEGRHRAWLAGIIEEGLRIKILREETQGYGNGWRDVIDLLRQSSRGPVVTSYSMTDSFPGELSFDRAMQRLRLDRQSGLELSPQSWSALRFGDGLSALDLKDAFDRCVSSAAE